MASPVCSSLEHKALVAIGALDRGLVAHFEIDARMPQGATAAVTGDAGVLGFDDLGGIDRHAKEPKARTKLVKIGRIIQVKLCPARADFPW